MKFFTRKKLGMSFDVASEILRDSLRTTSLTKKCEKILVALQTINQIFKDHPDVDWSYKDVLRLELSYYSRKEVPYIDGFTGKVKVIPFKKVEETSTAIIYQDTRQKDQLPQTYIHGNKAIGQIFINEREAYSTRIAVEHSLQTTIIRWLAQCYKNNLILERIEKV